ncbi:alpha-1,6-glucosidase domain-containing protein, partial [Vibrio sp. 10N.286.49.E1]|uniref:alpha-1,6-glucosidase domain-containing protein n=1 Tax=Vibrio sp. 10N.286.49.E1 TaxID=3229702 RepID=UPI00354B75AD
HTVQQSSADDTVKGASFAAETFTVPALTTAVFVQAQGDTQGAGLPVDNSDKDVSSIPPYGQTTVYVRGDMNEWGATDDWAMSFVANGVYSLTVQVPMPKDGKDGHGFKFADADWVSPNFGCDSVEFADGSINLGTGGNCQLSVTEAGSYTFTLNAIHELDDNVEKAVVSVIKN